MRRIYEYGYKEFDEEQADEYFYSFFEAFLKISGSPLIYHSVDNIRLGYRRCPHRSGVIYYRVKLGTVEIMAVIGGQDTDFLSNKSKFRTSPFALIAVIQDIFLNGARSHKIPLKSIFDD